MNPGFENLWTISGVAGAIIAVLAAVLLVLRARGSLNARRLGRLAVLDYHEVDKNRRLVIVRRDDVEHLLLIGGPQDLLIEKALNKAGEENANGTPRTYRGDISEDLAALRPMPLRTPEKAQPHLRAVSTRTEPSLKETSGDKPDGETPTEPTLR